VDASTTATSLDVGSVLIGLLGGLAIFLFGMEQMTDAMKAVAGDGMRRLLGRLTRNRFLAAFTGAFVTAVIQSSSVTTVLVVGFISAGLISLSQSVGVIMGANVGTTITAQIIAFKVTQYALVLVAFGFALQFLSSREKARQVGTIIMGLGLIFLGMDLMSEGTKPLRSYEPFITAMQGIERPLLAMAAAALFTALVQSSSATTGIVIVLASQGFITLEAGIALALGANVGTCVTALLATIGKPRAAIRAATVHVVFNVAGALLWVGLIPELAEFVRQISPAAADLSGAARLADETPRQIANAHTAFNLVNTLAFIGFTGPIARLVTWLVPERPPFVPERARPRFLDDVFLETPSLALDRLRLEIGHLGEVVAEVLEMVSYRVERPAFDRGPVDAAVEDARRLQESILDYARRLLQRELSAQETEELERSLAVANHVLNIADTLGVNVAAIVAELRQRRLAVSDETLRRFRAFRAQVDQAAAQAIRAYVVADRELAERVIGAKSSIVSEADALEAYLTERLAAGETGGLTKYRLEVEVIEIFKRLYYFAKRIAKTVAEDVAEPEVTREVA
jgi:phosphate:Na+ symporter